ncbi:hypothetical protein KDN24_05525 [Bacillus sp. Bva_UNVM-123]|uniref:hypothetical protein n=1 Tax=Bacillus sp. Bva_UNVM-123 TaxID=2829798 RepID=UPI00391F8EBC
MPAYEAFLSGENLVKFWEFVKWILFLVAPGVLIWIAVQAIGHLVDVVKKSIAGEANKDDDDYDVYRY